MKTKIKPEDKLEGKTKQDKNKQKQRKNKQKQRKNKQATTTTHTVICVMYCGNK